MTSLALTVLRHFARPYPTRAMTKKRAGAITAVGGVCIVTGSALLVGVWSELSLVDRSAFITGLALSFWLMPWTWANLLRQQGKNINS